jgi:multiple sugar transport system ATP-binding protein
MPDLTLQNISKSFRVARGSTVSAVQNFSLHVREGEFITILGPSGSGKTTLLRLIAGLEEADHGTIGLGNREMNGVTPGERNVAMVFQGSSLYPHMTVGENLGFPLRLRKERKAEIDRSVLEAAQLLGIGGLLERKPEALSGGEKQRVALGRALVQRPEIFLLDEPLSNLDAAFRLELRRQISELHRRLKTTMVYVTHDQVEALTLGERVVVMREGFLEQAGTPDEIYDRPATTFVAGFVGVPAMNLIAGRIVEKDKALYFLADGDTGPLLKLDSRQAQFNSEGWANSAVLFGNRPEHIRLADGEAAHVVATIELIERTGPQTFLHLRRGKDRFSIALNGCGSFQIGQQVGVRMDVVRGHFFDAQSGRRLG